MATASSRADLMFAGQQAYWRLEPFDAARPADWQRGWVIAAREGAVTLAESRTLIENRTALANASAAALALVRQHVIAVPSVRADIIAQLEAGIRILTTYDATPISAATSPNKRAEGRA